MPLKFRRAVALAALCAFLLTGCAPRVSVSIDRTGAVIDNRVVSLEKGDRVDVTLTSGERKHGLVAHRSEDLLVLVPDSKSIVGHVAGDSVPMQEVARIDVLGPGISRLGVAVMVGFMGGVAATVLILLITSSFVSID